MSRNKREGYFGGRSLGCAIRCSSANDGCRLGFVRIPRVFNEKTYFRVFAMETGRFEGMRFIEENK